jgi:tetratricopeptide (TPR) repeat protein
MSRAILLTLINLTFELSSLAVTAADPPKPWVGDKVFARKPGQAIVYVEGPISGTRYVSTLLYLDYTVLSEDKAFVIIRLQVGGRTTTGRIGKIDVVRLDEAAEFFTKVLQITPKNEGAIIQRGWALHLTDDQDKAIEDYDVAVKLKPKLWFVWNNRALIRIERGDLDGALDDIQEAAKLNPESALPVYNRGLVRLRQKDYSAAILEFDAALKIDPDYAVAFLDRGAAHEAQKSFDLARKDYETGCRLDPESPSGWARRAWLLAVHPDAEQRHGMNAIGYAKIACELSRWKDAVCLATLAAAYAEAGRFDEAVKWQQKANAATKKAKTQDSDGTAVLEQYRQKKAMRLSKT